jgi:TPR repeat protein
MRRTAAAFTALALCCPCQSWSQDSTATLIAICDRAAASPLDQNRPTGIEGVTPGKIDPTIAVPACTAAVKAAPNDARIAYQLGRAYFAAKNHESARVQYAKADEMGYALATNNLAVMYLDGLGVPSDKKLALSLLEKAANGGVATAMVALADQYMKGDVSERDYAKARTWYEKAAGLGNSTAMFSLGLLYHTGNGVPQDYAEARHWYEKAAALEVPGALVNLGLLYRNGLGVPQDYAEARRLLEKAAELGVAKAMIHLGVLHANGLGVPQDYGKAIAEYNKAIEIDPKSAEAYNARAWTYFKDGKATEGLPDAEKSLELRPDNPFFLNTRGQILEALGRREDAIADFRSALAKNPNIQESKDGLKRLGAAP